MTGAPDWETVKVIVGGGIGVFAIWTLGKIVKMMVDLVQTRDKNQMERDDKRDKLLDGVQATLAAQDVSFKKLFEAQVEHSKELAEAIKKNERRWEEWEEHRKEQRKEPVE